jgi:amino acid transporter
MTFPCKKTGYPKTCKHLAAKKEERICSLKVTAFIKTRGRGSIIKKSRRGKARIRINRKPPCNSKSPMTTKNKDKKPKIILIVVLIFIVICIIVVFIMGVKGILKIISTIAVIGIIAAFIFLLAYAFWFMFIKKQRFDPVFVNKQKLIRSGKMNIPAGLLNNLFISNHKIFLKNSNVM